MQAIPFSIRTDTPEIIYSTVPRLGQRGQKPYLVHAAAYPVSLVQAIYNKGSTMPRWRVMHTGACVNEKHKIEKVCNGM